MKWLRAVVGSLWVLSALVVRAQTSTTIEPWGTLPASRVTGALGLNIGTALDQMGAWQAAAAMHAVYGRFECDWYTIEQQSPPPRNVPASPQYALPARCAAAMSDAQAVGMKPDVVFSLSPPFHTLLLVNPVKAISAGDKDVDVALLSGTNGSKLSDLKPGVEWLCVPELNDLGLPNMQSPGCGYLTNRGQIAGTYIQSWTILDSTHVRLHLASQVKRPFTAVNGTVEEVSFTPNSGVLHSRAGAFSAFSPGHTVVTIPNSSRGRTQSTTSVIRSVSPDGSSCTIGAQTFQTGTQTIQYSAPLAITETLYAPPATPSPSDAYWHAFANAASYVGQQIGAGGGKGVLEIWNEPGGYVTHDNSYNPGTSYDGVFYGAWSPTMTYAAGATVSENGRVYASLVNNNRNSDPASSRSAWSATIPQTSYPGPVPFSVATFGLSAAVQAYAHFPAGVSALSGATWNSSNSSLMIPKNLGTVGAVLSQPLGNLTGEVYHPYTQSTVTPEQGSGLYACMVANAVQHTNANCNPPGISGQSNEAAGFVNDIKLQLAAGQLGNPAYGLTPQISESNVLTYAPNQARGAAIFDIRQYLTFLADGTTLFDFFQLWDGSDPSRGDTPKQSFGFAVFDRNTHTLSLPYTRYTSMQAWMADLAQIKGAALPSKPADVATVASYAGSYPLAVYNLLGRRAGASQNSQAVVLFQRTFAPYFAGEATGDGKLTVSTVLTESGLAGTLLPGMYLCQGLSGLGTCDYDQGAVLTGQTSGTPGGAGTYTVSSKKKFSGDNSSNHSIVGDWLSIPSPTPGTATLMLPAGESVTGAVDLITRNLVPVRVAGRQATLKISDDPIEILLDPTGVHAPALQGTHR